MKKIFALLFTSALAVTMFSCKKEGPAGPAGINGTNGVDGKDGNANVMSIKFTLTGAQWDYPGHYAIDYGNNQVALQFSRTHSKDIPEITKDVIDNGLVLVYMIPKGVHNYMPLPLTAYVPNTDINHNFTYEFRQGNIRLHYYWTANSKGTVVPNTLETSLMPFYQFKVVIMTGPASSTLKKSGVNLKDPVAVEKVLGL